MATPAVAGKAIFVRKESHLYRVEKRPSVLATTPGGGHRVGERADPLDRAAALSPGFMKMGGLRAEPTPAGLPVAMRSPGRRVRMLEA